MGSYHELVGMIHLDVEAARDQQFECNKEKWFFSLMVETWQQSSNTTNLIRGYKVDHPFTLFLQEDVNKNH